MVKECDYLKIIVGSIIIIGVIQIIFIILASKKGTNEENVTYIREADKDKENNKR